VTAEVGAEVLEFGLRDAGVVMAFDELAYRCFIVLEDVVDACGMHQIV
jgi:hypothetical protein